MLVLRMLLVLPCETNGGRWPARWFWPARLPAGAASRVVWLTTRTRVAECIVRGGGLAGSAAGEGEGGRRCVVDELREVRAASREFSHARRRARASIVSESRWSV